MAEPRWHRSQREIETALARGPRTVKEIQAETGYSYNTIMNALGRAATTRERGWPAKFALVSSFFEDGPSAPVLPLPEPQLVHIVKPIEIPMEDVGPKWQAGRTKIGQEIADIDLESLKLRDAIKHLEIETASLLGVLLQLRAVKDGPDWREQIGLTP